MPTSAQPNGSPNEHPPKSRLEREIEEILERAERDQPLPPPTPIRPNRPNVKAPFRDFRENVHIPDVASSIRRWLETAPLLVAFAFAFIAIMVGRFSPLLATFAAIASVVALFWPVVASTRAPRVESKTWRGQTYNPRQEPPEAYLRVREWLRRRGILK